jgi:hypothetical protein
VQAVLKEGQTQVAISEDVENEKAEGEDVEVENEDVESEGIEAEAAVVAVKRRIWPSRNYPRCLQVRT